MSETESVFHECKFTKICLQEMALDSGNRNSIFPIHRWIIIHTKSPIFRFTCMKSRDDVCIRGRKVLVWSQRLINLISSSFVKCFYENAPYLRRYSKFPSISLQNAYLPYNWRMNIKYSLSAPSIILPRIIFIAYFDKEIHELTDNDIILFTTSYYLLDTLWNSSFL